MEKETAEVSSTTNWLHPQLRSAGLDIYDIEGYSLDEDTESVELLIDRVRVDDVRGYNPGRVWREYQGMADDDEVHAKHMLARRADCDYTVALYDDERVRVYFISEHTAKPLTDELTFPEFGVWVFSHNSTTELSKEFIHDEQFPSLDAALRANGTPWPPNLDGFWYDGDRVRCLIEYQTTNVTSPANHSNNRYFSEDLGRWKHLWGMAEALDLPLVIVVWSPNDQYADEVKVKLVHDVQFVGRERGLSYADVKLLDADSVAEHLAELVD
ncbi:hypothetical protein HUG10_21495 (plasmid) [Halorarum halophilum]|uniref:Uncharacterized protein n=1 Tax=Halorarum halophilum TaxID=2743090 RepID=A0A7D5GF00_9EURY|nr:hypothetical protein [Halobaculum halophilum]QLG30165.1 hypothetical protein HUG10_21495 [Halobaculum halophilum]